MKLQQGTMSKLLSHVFAQIDGVVWDLMSNQTGIKREDGIYTMKDGQIELNPFDAFAMELPAFSQLIPIDQVNAGDVLVSNGRPTGWVLNAIDSDEKKTQRAIQALSFQGHQTRFRPKKVSMMGIENGITVVRSPFNFGGGSGGSGSGDMMSMLPMLMLAGDGNGSKVDMKTMAMMSMMGNGGNMAGMNPMMLAMMFGEGGFSKR